MVTEPEGTTPTTPTDGEGKKETTPKDEKK